MKFYLYMASGVIIFSIGVFVGLKFNKPGTPQIIEKEKIVYETVYRDYSALTLPDCTELLKKYDCGIPRLDIAPMSNKPEYFTMTAGLGERDWSRDVRISVGESGGWKFYAGIGIGSAIVGGLGYLGWRAFK